MRFGLAGTGPWARLAHGPGLRSAAGIELVGVWGRDPAKAREVAAGLSVEAYDDYPALLDEVEAMAFAVPPEIQAGLATRAARAGKHLLLDKPVAGGVPAARELAAAAGEADVASVVFFTDRFVPEVRDWFESVRVRGGWQGGWLRWFSALQAPGHPFGHQSWRFERGALWDTGPHAISTLSQTLGPVVAVRATAGARDLVHLVFEHESGATSTASLTQFVPPEAQTYDLTLWGETGLSRMPDRISGEYDGPLRTAAEELVAAAGAGRTHPTDVHFGARVVELLAEAETKLR
ncbi:MAG: Gfo/Idh/MocA family protein [Nocardioides sp.]